MLGSRVRGRAWLPRSRGVRVSGGPWRQGEGVAFRVPGPALAAPGERGKAMDFEVRRDDALGKYYAVIDGHEAHIRVAPAGDRIPPSQQTQAARDPPRPAAPDNTEVRH